MPLPDLDRMLIEDVATSPERIAAEIHRQLGAVPAPIEVRDIALALDIVEIRERPLRGFEAALVTAPERDEGSILINKGAGARRQHYSIAHELGQFLCGWHEEVDAKGFLCTRQDMWLSVGADVHTRQEGEANLFAIELLAGGVACDWLGPDGGPNPRLFNPPVRLKKYVRSRRHAAGLISTRPY